MPGADSVAVQRSFSAYAPRRVTVTPLSTLPPSQQPAKWNKVLLKAVGKHGKKISTTFTLRNISVADTCTCSLLTSLIREQLQLYIMGF